MYENKFLNEFERQINLQLNVYYGKLCKKSRKLQRDVYVRLLKIIIQKIIYLGFQGNTNLSKSEPLLRINCPKTNKYQENASLAKKF